MVQRLVLYQHTHPVSVLFCIFGVYRFKLYCLMVAIPHSRIPGTCIQQFFCIIRPQFYLLPYRQKNAGKAIVDQPVGRVHLLLLI